MFLKDYMFNELDTVKLCCICINHDNKAVRRWKELYPLEVVTGEESLKGLYLEVEDESYYVVWNECSGVLAVKYCSLNDYYDVSEISVRLKGLLEFKGTEGLKKLLEQKEQGGNFINVAEIEAMRRLGEAELAVHYAQYREAYLERQRTEEEKKRRQRELEQQKKEEEKKRALEAQIEDAEKCIRENKRLKNDKLVDGRSVVLALMKKYEISVPLRTQGWINQKLAAVKYGEAGDIHVQYYSSKGSKGSESVHKYLMLMKQAVDGAA